MSQHTLYTALATIHYQTKQYKITQKTLHKLLFTSTHKEHQRTSQVDNNHFEYTNGRHIHLALYVVENI